MLWHKLGTPSEFQRKLEKEMPGTPRITVRPRDQYLRRCAMPHARCYEVMAYYPGTNPGSLNDLEKAFQELEGAYAVTQVEQVEDRNHARGGRSYNRRSNPNFPAAASIDRRNWVNLRPMVIALIDGREK